MNLYYFEVLKRALAETKMTREALQQFLDESQLFIESLRVKIGSRQSGLQTEASREIAGLKELLEACV